MIIAFLVLSILSIFICKIYLDKEIIKYTPLSEYIYFLLYLVIVSSQLYILIDQVMIFLGERK